MELSGLGNCSSLHEERERVLDFGSRSIGFARENYVMGEFRSFVYNKRRRKYNFSYFLFWGKTCIKNSQFTKTQLTTNL